MKLPRGLAGHEVARLLARHYGYRVTRSRGSHMTATLAVGAAQHSVTIPRHREVRVGTLHAIVTDVTEFLELSRQEVGETLFG